MIDSYVYTKNKVINIGGSVFFGNEFRILKRLFGEYLPPEYPYQVQGAQQTVFSQDFNNSVDIVPVCDPNIFSTTQRIILAQTQLQLAQSAPQIHNMKEAYRKMYIALNIKDIKIPLLGIHNVRN